MSKTDISRYSGRSSRNGAAAPFIIFGFVAITLVMVGAYFYINQNRGPKEIDPILSQVELGEFVSQVIDQGEAQSSENVEIRCEARARNGSLSVLTVVPEGTRVKGGDFLVQLDSTAFEKELEQQNIALANAETGVIQAESNLETAKATKKEYIEGTLKQEQMKIENEVNKAQNDIISANIDLQEALDLHFHNKKLMAKGYATQNQLTKSETTITEAKNLVAQGELNKKLAEEKLRVLTEISAEKEKIKLEKELEYVANEHKPKHANNNKKVKPKILPSLPSTHSEILCSICGVDIQNFTPKYCSNCDDSFEGDNTGPDHTGCQHEKQCVLRQPYPPPSPLFPFLVHEVSKYLSIMST